MATSKTLTPTNVTIQIPEFTDQPDQRVNSNCIDKEADAINALNSKFATEVLTATRTENTLVNSTAFARLYFYKKSEFFYATFNLGVTTAVNSMADFVEIGRINGWNAIATADVTIVPQSGSNKVMLAEITDNGIIKIYGANGLDAGFYRAIIMIPKT